MGPFRPGRLPGPALASLITASEFAAAQPVATEAFRTHVAAGMAASAVAIAPLFFALLMLRRRSALAAEAQERTEQALRAAELRFRVMTEQMHDVIWQMTPDLVVTFVSPSDQRLRGFRPDEVIGKSYWRVLTPGSGERLRSRLVSRGNFHADGSIVLELEQACANGATVWTEAIFSPIHRDGDLVGFQGVTRDIGDRRRMQQALREANAKLEARIGEIHALKSALEREAIHDALTGLFNRRYLDETLVREIDRARREGYPVTLAMMDLDHFKRINDTLGHPAGDLMLQRVGALLLQRARSGDIPCRYGGEEFVLVLPYMGPEAARDRADEWRRMLERLRVPFGEAEMGTTTSIGLASFPVHGANERELIAAADAALYAAKAAGRNCVVTCSGGRTGASIHPFVMNPAGQGGAPC